MLKVKTFNRIRITNFCTVIIKTTKLIMRINKILLQGCSKGIDIAVKQLTIILARTVMVTIALKITVIKLVEDLHNIDQAGNYTPSLQIPSKIH